MASNYLPPTSLIRVIEARSPIRKFHVPTTQRSFPSGTPLYNNGASGFEPALALAGDADLEVAQMTFAQGFGGFALEARVPQQLAGLEAFSAAGDTSVNSMDASRDFISGVEAGTAVGPCAALGAQVEIGALVGVAGFTNEATTGFYNAKGDLVKDTNKYLYNNKVVVVTDPDLAIGRVVERAPVGQTWLMFEFGVKAINFGDLNESVG